ncbi:MAG: hypothetical protein OEL83_01590 [Desulforhopalus sp.]|nr:hypothetical protein [Desulforhopalus sp.]
MGLENHNTKLFLEFLHQMTSGNTETQVSMYEVGTAMGLAKVEAGALAEELMVAGLVELRTLAGGISITHEGMETLGVSQPAAYSANIGQQLSKDSIASTTDCQLLKHLLDDIKANLYEMKPEYQQLEEIIIDIKTIEVQLLSPRPKNAVFRELLRSLHASFVTLGNAAMAANLETLSR